MAIIRKRRWILGVVLVAALAGAGVFLALHQGSSAAPGAVDADGYAGSEACQKCHPNEYSLFSVSGHPWKLVSREQARARNLPLPAGYNWDDISYVIGGYKWKARYINNSGLIITTTAEGPGKNQYNMMTGRWADYHAGEVKEYNCGRCHTTGWVAATSEVTAAAADGAAFGDRMLPGMAGTFVFGGVQCENCHGPAADHVAGGGSPKPTVDDSAAFCGNCHIRGDKDTIPAKGGFIRHHEQYNEFLASPHKDMDCVTCHDPHTKAEFSIETECADCHSDVDEAFTGSSMEQVGVTCEDCHMPMATKSAEKLGDYQGDVKTHLFRINTDPEASMFSEDGKFANDYLTVDFACLQCHQNEDVDWAANYARGAHALGTESSLQAAKVDNAPTVDGDATDAGWSAASELALQSPKATLKAVYTDTDLYILARWPDPTASFTRSGSWSWTGSAWVKSAGQSEDRIAFMWSMDTPGFVDNGCAMKCHPGTHDPGGEDDAWLEAGTADMWHMKAARSLGVTSASQSGTLTIDPATHEVTAGSVTMSGYIDDKHVGQWSADNDPDGGRYGDAGTSSYSHNRDADKTAPLYMETAPTDYMDAMILTQTEIDGAETAEVATLSSGEIGALWANYEALGAVVPERILRTPAGSRADVLEAATWSNGTWTAEFKRALDTGNPEDDVIFDDLTKGYPFGVALMDNTGGEGHRLSGKIILNFE